MNNIKILIDTNNEYENLVKEGEFLRFYGKICSEKVIDLFLDGIIITWNNEASFKEPRFYRFNSKDKVIEYSDNIINWNKSNKTLKSFKGEWRNIEWLISEKI